MISGELDCLWSRVLDAPITEITFIHHIHCFRLDIFLERSMCLGLAITRTWRQPLDELRCSSGHWNMMCTSDAQLFLIAPSVINEHTASKECKPILIRSSFSLNLLWTGSIWHLDLVGQVFEWQSGLYRVARGCQCIWSARFLNAIKNVKPVSNFS